MSVYKRHRHNYFDPVSNTWLQSSAPESSSSESDGERDMEPDAEANAIHEGMKFNRLIKPYYCFHPLKLHLCFYLYYTYCRS